MKLFRQMGWSGFAVCIGLLVTGCASYYKVTEPVSGRVYYTDEVRQQRGGSASFTDAASGSEVTIQNSEIKEISGDEFDAGLKAAKTKPAPAPAAPAATTPSSSAPAPAEKSTTDESSSAAPAEESK